MTITRPSILLETDETGRSNWSSSQTGSGTGASPANPESIEDMIAGRSANGGPEESSAEQAIAALDRLRIGRVTIADGTLIWRDQATSREERIDALNLDIRVPKLDRAGTVTGSFSRLGIEQSLELEIGERPDPARFTAIPVTLTLSADAGTLTAQGTALTGDTLFDGTIETEGNSFAGFARGFGVDLPDMPAFGNFTTTTRVSANTGQIRIDEYAVDLGGVRARGGAVIGLDRARPGIGLKIIAEQIDTALFLENNDSGGGGESESTTPASSADDDMLDLSALGLIDANIDFSTTELLIGAVPVTNLGVDIQIVNGGLNGKIRSATVNGAPGTGTLLIDSSGAVPAINGNVKLNGLDAAGLVALAGAVVPVKAGSVGIDASFATSGATQQALLDNLDGNGRVTLVNGQVTGLGLADFVGGDADANEVDDVDFVAEFSSLNEPVKAKGGFTWRGERFSITARGDPRALAAGTTSAVAINATSNRVEFGFTGEAGVSGLGNGAVNLSTPSLRGLLAWIGQPLDPGGGLEAFSISGAINLTENAISFEKADFTLDGSSGVGTGSVSFGGTPKISAGLAMKKLDVTPYMIASGAQTSGSSGGTGTSGGGSSGWSSRTISFAGLRAIDANLNLKADEIIADQIKIGPSILTANIAGGKLSAELTEMALYSGFGVGTLSVDGSSATPSLAAFFRLDGIDALSFLRDAADFSRIEGTASLSFDIKSSGDSEAALMSGLDGTGAMDFRNGAIRGIDIPKLVRTLSIETLLGWQQDSTDKTEFSRFSGTYTIAQGILTNEDLVLVGPLLRVTGAGRVDIPAQTLNYRVDPKIVASLEGQGGSQDLEGFAVPVRVEGSWSQPRIYPEIEGILKDPQGALDQLRKLGGGLFGGSGGASQQSTDGSASKSVEERLTEEVTKGLGQLFGGSSSGTSAPAVPPPTEAIPPVESAPSETAPASDAPQPAGTEEAPPPANQPPLDPTTPMDQIINAPSQDTLTDGDPQSEAPQAQPSDPAVDLLKSLFGK